VPGQAPPEPAGPPPRGPGRGRPGPVVAAPTAVAGDVEEEVEIPEGPAIFEPDEVDDAPAEAS